MPYFRLERCQLCKDNGPSHGLERKGFAVTTIANVRLCARHLESLIGIAAENNVNLADDYLRNVA